jgi:hypothetical protein
VRCVAPAQRDAGDAARATPPSRNNLSHANKERDAALAEKIFWAVLAHLQALQPGFARGNRGKGVARRFKRVIHVVDSTTIQLVASCMDWAKHRRRKAAAKCHLRLDLHSFLPRFAIIDTARENDALRSRELCAGIRSGEIVLFDKAYLDFLHLFDLDQRGVCWVTRAKDNLAYDVVGELPVTGAKILRDELIVLSNPAVAKDYPGLLRRVVALVEIDGKEQEMVFLSNNLEWSPASIADLYRNRWSIEAFFKQIKQTLQLADFWGTAPTPCAGRYGRRSGAIRSFQQGSTRAIVSLRLSPFGTTIPAYRRSPLRSHSLPGGIGGGGTSKLRRQIRTCSSPCLAAVSALLRPVRPP